MQSIAVPQVAPVNHQQSDESLNGKGMEAKPRRGACQQRARACMPTNNHEPSVAGFGVTSAPGRGARRQRVRSGALVTVLGLVFVRFGLQAHPGRGARQQRAGAHAAADDGGQRAPHAQRRARRSHAQLIDHHRSFSTEDSGSIFP